MFLLEYEGKYQAWIGYKEASTGNTAFKVNSYYHTDWLAEKELPVHIDGLNMDTIYENFVRQCAGNSLQPENKQETLKESIERDEKINKLQIQIKKFEKMARNEKQPNKKFELVKIINGMKQELENL